MRINRDLIISLLSKNILYLISLLISLSLWFYVLSTEPLQIEKNINFKLKLASNKSVATAIPKKVVVTLSGPKAFVRDLSEEKLALYFDLEDESKTQQKILKLNLLNGLIELPLGVKIIKTVPETLAIKFAKRSTKDVEIKPILVGEVLEGHKMIISKLLPKKIKVHGPQIVLNQIVSLKTKPIDISNLKGEGQIEVYIDEDDPRLMYDKTQEYFLDYAVRPTQANLQINNVKIRFLSSRRIVSATSKEVSLLVLSDKGENTRIDPSKIKVIADIPENAKGKVKVKLKVDLPNDLYLIKIQPDEIFVRVK